MVPTMAMMTMTYPIKIQLAWMITLSSSDHINRRSDPKFLVDLKSLRMVAAACPLLLIVEFFTVRQLLVIGRRGWGAPAMLSA